MRKRLVALCLGPLLAGHAVAADPPAPPVVESVKLPDPPKPVEVKTPVGVPVKLTAAGKGVRWEAGCEAAGRTWFLLPDSGGGACTVVAVKPGRYLVLAYAAAGDVATAASRTVVVAGEPDPLPVPPGPPVPPAPPIPVPPIPVPPAPVPADPFRDKLLAAYLADVTTANKADKADTLREIYKQAAVLAGATTLATPGELVDKIKAAAAALGLLPTDLAEVRKVVAGELAAAADPARPFDTAARVALAGVYRRAAAALVSAN